MSLSKIAIAFSLSLATTLSIAMSKPYDATVGAVIKDGMPCFFSLSPLDVPAYLQGHGVSMRMYSESGNGSGALWSVWFRKWQKTLPTTAATCVVYGIKSPDNNQQPAKTLPVDAPLSFSFGGEWGRQNVEFCIRKDEKGRRYLSGVKRHDGIAECTETQLRNTEE
ncbi:hypothetical protein [Aquitalea palustris]|uniref:hypothetical protein n=1 Tax=Aquitalea palustris TaxID=2480983 RepID=UPI0011C42A01|nr:hypothetical protein [Aquitalea palustris]